MNPMARIRPGIIKPSEAIYLNTANQMARGLVSAWLINEGSGSIVKDYGRLGNDMQFGSALDPTTDWTVFQNGSTVQFGDNGRNGRLQAVGGAAKTYFAAAELFSIAARVYLPSTTVNDFNLIIALETPISNDFPLYMADFAGYRSFNWGLNANYLRGGFGGINIREIYEDRWVSLVVSRISTSGGATGWKFYIDGALQEPIDGVSGSLSSFTCTETCIGAHSSVDHWDFEGYIDYVYVYDRILTNAEAYSLHVEPFQMFSESNINAAFLGLAAAGVSVGGGKKDKIIGGF
jgi:hypothetical protein